MTRSISAIAKDLEAARVHYENLGLANSCIGNAEERERQTAAY